MGTLPIYFHCPLRSDLYIMMGKVYLLINFLFVWCENKQEKIPNNNRIRFLTLLFWMLLLWRVKKRWSISILYQRLNCRMIWFIPFFRWSIYLNFFYSLIWWWGRLFDLLIPSSAEIGDAIASCTKLNSLNLNLSYWWIWENLLFFKYSLFKWFFKFSRYIPLVDAVITGMT